ncbi:hypothetical protein ACIP29_07560 [Streptomyces coelicoflavus]|uniref:Secreted protein n=1 Tax=Streptomyces coelicoflavus TaxID=285562 RepID=A0A6N9UNU8_9ACTN|nr:MULTISPECIES: hypothetical protein [Streptomyces]EHN72607.1 secreted protein [Streptomyces coelicoflavus ZG0656]MZE47676.1 hypothetical protein [Streptomyces sp. SID5477]NEB17920.1 hypothetical protein [Streptomyces coelicoflavus]OWA12629.1 hypothetical protein B9W64_20245 [Streptomyces sp. CS159]
MRRSSAKAPASAPQTAAAGADFPRSAPAAASAEAPAAPPAAAPVDTAPRQQMRTEFPFELPRGYVDDSGTVHKDGVMRLATARDELIPLRDVRVQENPAYLSVVLLGRVITRLGTLAMVHDGVVENMFASDLAFLQDFYRQINAEGHTRAAVECPHCSEPFEVELGGSRLGES